MVGASASWREVTTATAVDHTAAVAQVANTGITGQPCCTTGQPGHAAGADGRNAVRGAQPWAAAAYLPHWEERKAGITAAYL